MISATELSSAFPNVKIGIQPSGPNVLVQLRKTRDRTESGLYIAKSTQEFNDATSQFAKLVAVGPLAFHNRSTGEPWPEGVWAKVGDIVRVPKYGGDRMMYMKDGIIFIVFDDYLVNAVVDPEQLSSLDELV